MSEINYDIINQYLDGELSGEALLAFEKEMQSNPALAEEVALYKRINEEMQLAAQQQNDEQRLKESLGKLNHEYFNEPGGKVRSINRWWYAAVTAAAAAILLFVVKPFSGESFDHNKQFAHYTQKMDPLPEGERGNGMDSLLTKAAMLYNRQDYTQAFPLLREILLAKPAEAQLKLALGICYLQTGQYDSAVLHFDAIAAGTSVFNSEAVWFKALTMLKQNKLDDCYQVLGSMPATASRYKEAQELMRKIDKQRKAK